MTDPSPPAAAQPEPGAAAYPRKVLFVAGAGRSGTSTLSGIMSLLGLHVPQPEVVADDSNPKGFGEPQWVVDTHHRLLAEAVVTVSDSRPSAWAQTEGLAARERERAGAAAWLEPHFAEGRELVVKDPRLSWFLPLWRSAAVRTGATPVFATMLRAPAEVVGSKEKYYSNRLGSAHLAASWLNMLLHTERATRAVAPGSEPGAGAEGGPPDGGSRVFVRYADLLADWTRTTAWVGEALDLQHVRDAGDQARRRVDGFVDPSLRRVTASLDDLGLPPRLHELVVEAWAGLDALAEPGGDTPERQHTLDQLREGYVALYQESEAIARSSAVATGARARRQGRDEGRSEAQAEAEAGAKDARQQAPARRGIADRIPHGLRARIPGGVRRGLRRALRRPRPAP